MRLMGAQTLVVEEIQDGAPEWRRLGQEFAAIKTRLGTDDIETRVHKFTFAAIAFESEDELKKAPDSAFLGYAVVVNLQIGPTVYWSYISESVTRELGAFDTDGNWIPRHDYYLHVKNAFTCSVGSIRTYQVVGSYFCQQNAITNVCAHACAAMSLTNCPSTGEIVTPEDVNQIIGYDQSPKKQFSIDAPLLWNDRNRRPDEHLPAGLSWRHLETVFKTKNYKSYLYEFFTERHQHRFRSFLYGFVESGFPSVLSYASHIDSDDGLQHVVSVVGHTLNPHSWLPLPLYHGSRNPENPESAAQTAQKKLECEELSSLSWVDDLVIHDDNYGMQLCLPGHAFKPVQHPDYEANFTPDAGMGIFPINLNVKLLGHDAQLIAASAFKRVASAPRFLGGSYYTERLWSAAREALRHGIVYRTLLVKWPDYLASLAPNSAFSGAAREFIEKIESLHSHVWLVEVMEPDLLIGNQAKIIDIILDPTFDPMVNRDGTGFECEQPERAILMMRFPQGLRVPDSDHLHWRAVQGWPIHDRQHYPVFKLKQIPVVASVPD